MYHDLVTIRYAINGSKELDPEILTLMSENSFTIDSIVSRVVESITRFDHDVINTIEIFTDKNESLGVFEIDKESTKFFHCNRVKE